MVASLALAAAVSGAGALPAVALSTPSAPSAPSARSAPSAVLAPSAPGHRPAAVGTPALRVLHRAPDVLLAGPARPGAARRQPGVSGLAAQPAPSGVTAPVSVTYSTNPGWYLGTDGRTPAGRYDLETVVLHELTHGLGFLGSVEGLDPGTGRDTGRGYWGAGPSQPYTFVFDRFLADDTAGRPLLSAYANGSTALGAALRTGLRWTGARGAAAGRRAPVLVAPRRWQEGSSGSHLDETTYPAGSGNELMTPVIGAGESDHLPGPVVLGMLADMGWTVTAAR